MQALTKVLEKKMDRKEFIQHLGIGFLMLCGGGLIMNGLNAGQRERQSTAGYGSSPYGR